MPRLQARQTGILADRGAGAGSLWHALRMSEIVMPATLPVRLPDEAELAAAARLVLPLRQARALADWVGDTPVSRAEGFRSPRARLDAAQSLGLIASDGTVTAEIVDRLEWLYEVAYHAGYLHAEDHFTLIHRNEDRPPGDGTGGMDDLADDEILTDWKGALDALFAHGLERAVPDGSNPKPLQFHGTGAYPLLRLLQLGGSASAGAVSEEIFATVTEGLPATHARQRWTEWTAKHGDPTRVFLRLAADLGAVTLDGEDSEVVTLTPLGALTLIKVLKIDTEQLPDAAAMTAHQLIICRMGMGDEAFGRELAGWLAVRQEAGTVREILNALSDIPEGDYGYLITGLRIAAGIDGDTEAAWREAATAPPDDRVRPFAIAELSRRAGRSPWRESAQGLEFLDCDAVVMASHTILASYALTGRTARGEGIRRALDEAAELATGSASTAELFERMWRSRHAVAEHTLDVIGEWHPDKKTAKAARTAAMKATSSRRSRRPA